MELEKVVDKSTGNGDKSFHKKLASGGNLLKIEPLELRFTFEPKKQIFCCLYLSNVTKNYVAFKVLTNNVTNYCVRPNTGIILPQATCGITVTKKAEKKPPTGMQYKDKFKIQSVVASPDIAYITKNVFDKKVGYVIEECKLPVVYLSAPLPRMPESEEANNLQTDDENLNSSQGEKMSTMELFNVQPEELIFPFKVNKQISSTLQLSNMTENYVAVKVMTTHPKIYCAQPNKAVMAPQSTSDIRVTMQAQKAPPNAQRKDKFLIRSTVVSPSTTENDINRNTFDKEGLVNDIKLRVVHTFTPQAAFPVAERSDSKGDSSKTVSWMHTDSFDYPQEITSHNSKRNLPGFTSIFRMIVRFFGLTSRSYDGYQELDG